MASAESPSSVIVRFADILDAVGIPYMLTGSFASGIHGQPRASHDIDFVIAPTLGSLNQLLKKLPEQEYYVSREAAGGLTCLVVAVPQAATGRRCQVCNRRGLRCRSGPLR